MSGSRHCRKRRWTALPGWLALLLHLLTPFATLLPSGANAGELTVICTSQGLQTVLLPGEGGGKGDAAPEICNHCLACGIGFQPAQAQGSEAVAAIVPYGRAASTARQQLHVQLPLEQAPPPRAPPQTV